MNIKRWTLITGLFVALLAVVVLVAPTALAAPPDGEGPGLGGPGRGGRALIRTAAEVIGITPQELITELREGEDLSIADVATAHGASADDIVDAVVAKASEHLAEKVANGELTQDEADAHLAEIEAHVTERINTPFSPPEPGQHPHHGQGPQGGQGAPSNSA